MAYDRDNDDSRYEMEDGTVVRPRNAVEHWSEGKYWDGNNWCSLATGSQWEHQRLFRSRKGRYWLEYWSDWQGSRPHAEWLSHEAAARWLVRNEHDDEMPDDLKEVAEKLEE